MDARVFLVTGFFCFTTRMGAGIVNAAAGLLAVFWNGHPRFVHEMRPAPMSFAPPPEFPDDNANPYAAPRAELRPRPIVDEDFLGAIPVTIDDILSRSWEIYKARMGICLAIVMGAVGLNFAFSIVTNLFQVGLTQAQIAPAAVALVGLFLSLVGVVIQLWLTAGQTVGMLRVAKGRDVDFSALFSGGPYLLPIIGASLLTGLAIFGLIIACLIPVGIVAAVVGSQSPAMIGVGIVAFLVVIGALIFISLRLSQIFYLIVDRGVGAVEAIGLSNRITKGREGQIFLVFLMSMAANIVGALACLVGLIFSVPFTYVLTSVLYVALTGQQTPPMLDGSDFIIPESKIGPEGDFGRMM